MQHIEQYDDVYIYGIETCLQLDEYYDREMEYIRISIKDMYLDMANIHGIYWIYLAETLQISDRWYYCCGIAIGTFDYESQQCMERVDELKQNRWCYCSIKYSHIYESSETMDVPISTIMYAVIA